MSIGNLNFDDISEGNLLDLIEIGVPEGLKIEYKSQLYGNSNSDKKEALKDISSLGNSFGGHIIIGMEEEEGLPTRIRAIQDINPDDTVLRLENLARDGIEPRITGIRMKAITISSGGHVIIIRIPKSWNPPHRVSAKNTNRFYIRNSAGSHETSVEELRALFSLSATMSEKVTAFRHNRLAKISVDEGPIKILHEGVLIVHIVPFSAFNDPNIVDIKSVQKQSTLFRPLDSNGWNSRFNFDGFMNFRPSDVCHGYTQVFRSGIIEATKSPMVFDSAERGRVFSGKNMGSHVLQVLPGYLEGLKRLNVSPPFVIMLSLQDVQGAYIYDDDYYWSDGLNTFEKSELLLPEITINDYPSNEDLQKLMRPAFDTLWNAGGYEESNCFDDNDLWI